MGFASHPASRLCLVTPSGDSKERGQLGPGLSRTAFLPALPVLAVPFARSGWQGGASGGEGAPPPSAPQLVTLSVQPVYSQHRNSLSVRFNSRKITQAGKALVSNLPLCRGREPMCPFRLCPSP